MSASHAPASEGLLALAAALDGFPAVQVERAGGERDGEEFWHLMLAIDHENPDAWATVAALSSIFNAGAAGQGGAVFKPVSLSIENGGPGAFPYWTISHFYGSYSPDDALSAVNRFTQWQSGQDATADEGANASSAPER